MNVPEKITLLENASADSAYFKVGGGRYCFIVSATFGGGSVALEILGPDGSTAIAIPSASLTSNTAVVVDLPPGQVRANITTATAVYAQLVSIPYR